MSRGAETREFLIQWKWTLLASTSSMAFLSCFARIGADWDWLVALGDYLRDVGEAPDGIPFAVAETRGWHNVPVLAELVASLLHGVGPRIPLIIHLAIVTTTLAITATTARSRGSSDADVAWRVALLCFGGLASFGIVRAQTFSFALFAVLVAVLVRQARSPDRRVWWAVPLMALWGNLHGAALLGACVLGAYLLAQGTRTHFWRSVAVGLASLVALCATPELWRTPLYYAGVFSNVSAQRGEGLWARPSVDMPFDVLMLMCVLLMLVRFVRVRRQAWEYVAVVGLCVATADSARHGVWLLILLAALAGGRDSSPPRTRADAPRSDLTSVTRLSVVGTLAALGLMFPRGDTVLAAPFDVVDQVTSVADGRTVLAPAPLSEALAVGGAQLWVTNPLDAFTHRDQAAYLDFLDGQPGGLVAVAAADVVVAREGSAQAALVEDDEDFEARPCGEDWICFVRR